MSSFSRFRPILRSSVLALTFVAFSAAQANAAYTPLSSAQIVARFNAFRVENGFPGAVPEDTSISAACRLHNNWMNINNLMTHYEYDGTAGYTDAGNNTAYVSVLAEGTSWAAGNPWLNAPFHLESMLNPLMQVTGASEEFNHSCLATNAQGALTPEEPTVDTYYSYPRDGGSMPYMQTVFEAPAAPQTVGASPIKDGTPTGPNLIGIYHGPQNDKVRPVMSSATLTGPNGASVPIKVVNRDDSNLVGSSTGIIIPRVTLKPGATYTWTSTFTAPADGDFPAFSYTSPARTFIANATRLCGAGAAGWYKAADCPAHVVRVTAPRLVQQGALRRPIRAVVYIDGPMRIYASMYSGRSPLAYRSISVRSYGRVVVPIQVTRAGRASIASLLKRRRSIVMVVAVSGSANARYARVTVTR